MPARIKKCGGMTLVEVLIALAFLSLIVVPVLNMLVSGTRLTTVSYKLTTAAVTAQMRMEELVGLNGAGLTNEINAGTVSYNGFFVKAEITQEDVQGYAHLKEVCVTVLDSDGVTAMYTLTNVLNVAPGGIEGEWSSDP